MATLAALPSGAQHGFANGALYDQHRPSYPPEAVARLLDELQLTGHSGARVVDLAAGTGKFTELLAARPEQYAVVAVEPHKGMRAELARKSLARVDVRPGFAAEIPLDDVSVDGLVCAQSFHWFATAPALASIARVLRPSAGLALIWNIEDYNNTLAHPSPHPWTLALRQLLFALDEHSPADTPAARFRNEAWRHVFDSSSSDEARAPPHPFAPLQETSFTWTVLLARDALWHRFSTLSQVAALDRAALAEVRARFDAALDAPATQTDEQGRIAVRGSTVLVWTRKIA